MRPSVAWFLSICVVGVLVGCSSAPDGDELVGLQTNDEVSYPVAYDEFLDTIELGAVGLVDFYADQKRVADYRILALNYTQSASEEQIGILIRELASASDVKHFVSAGCKIAPSQAFNVAVDGKPLSIGGGFSVNEEYCRTGELKWAFISSERLIEIGWTAEASRSIHLYHDGRFSQEVMPGFTGGVDYRADVGRPALRDVGLFVVKGSHDVTIPVGIRNVRVGGPLSGIWTAGWFTNERYN